MDTDCNEERLGIRLIFINFKNRKMIYKKIYVEDEMSEDTLVIPKERLMEVTDGRPFTDKPFVDSFDELDGKAIYLDEFYDWVLGRSKTGALVVVPLKKDKFGR